MSLAEFSLLQLTKGDLPVQDPAISTRPQDELWDWRKDVGIFGDSRRVSCADDIVDPRLARRQSERAVGAAGRILVERNEDVFAAIVLDKLFRDGCSGCGECQSTGSVELHSDCRRVILDANATGEGVGWS